MSNVNLLSVIPAVHQSMLSNNIIEEFINPALSDEQVIGVGYAKTNDLTYTITTSQHTFSEQDVKNVYRDMGIVVDPTYFINCNFNLPIVHAMMARPSDYVWTGSSKPLYEVCGTGVGTISQWGHYNHWKHRSAATQDELAISPRGTRPIIQYQSNIEQCDTAKIVRHWTYKGQNTTHVPTIFEIGYYEDQWILAENGILSLPGDVVQDVRAHGTFWVILSDVDVRVMTVLEATYNSTLNITKVTLSGNVTAPVLIIPKKDQFGLTFDHTSSVKDYFLANWDCVKEEWFPVMESNAFTTTMVSQTTSTSTTMTLFVSSFSKYVDAFYANGIRWYDYVVQGDAVTLNGLPSGALIEHKKHLPVNATKQRRMEFKRDGVTVSDVLVNVAPMEQIASPITTVPMFNLYDSKGVFVGADKILAPTGDQQYTNNLYNGAALYWYKRNGAFKTCWTLTESLSDSARFVNPNVVTKRVFTNAELYPWVKSVSEDVTQTTLRASDKSDLLFDAVALASPIVDVINWAANEYAKLPSNILDIVRIIPFDSTISHIDIKQQFNELFERNVKYSSVYGDSSMGINHIITLPRMGIIPAKAPVMLDSTHIYSHTGHLWDLSDLNADGIIKTWMLNGLTQIADINMFNNSVRTAYVAAKNLVLHNHADHISDHEPSTTWLGMTWYKPSVMSTHKWVGSTWEVVSNDTVLIDVSPNKLCIDMVMEYEQRMYQSCINVPRRYLMVSNYLNTPTFQASLSLQFDSWCKMTNKVTPAAKLNDPFTWKCVPVNAGDVRWANPQRSTWSYHWETLYKDQFGTQYIIQEPWKLQGFPAEPSWWRQKYHNGTDWTATMWDDIKSGVVNGVGGAHHGYHFIPVQDGKLIPPAHINSFIDPTKVDMTRFNESWAYGERGWLETRWNESIHLPYSVVIATLQHAPKSTFTDLWGEQLTSIDNMKIWTRTGYFGCTRDVILHGDYVNGSLQHIIGYNQWLVNWCRSTNQDLDVMLDRIKSAEVKLAMYVDKPIHEITVNSERVTVTPNDYNLTIRKISNRGEPKQFTSVLVGLNEIGGWEPYNSDFKKPIGWGDDWYFNIVSPTPYVTMCDYYTPRKWNFIGTAGSYTTSVGTHDLETGELIIVELGNVARYTQYYAIVTSSNTIQIAASKIDALAGKAIDSVLCPTGHITMGVPKWFVDSPYVSDPKYVRWEKSKHLVSTPFPIRVRGVQGVIDVVYGMVDRGIELGLVFNDIVDEMEVDNVTNVRLTWDVELSKFINKVMIGYDDTTALTSDAIGTRDRYSIINAMRNQLGFSHPNKSICDLTPSRHKLPTQSFGVYGYVDHELDSTDYVVHRGLTSSTFMTTQLVNSTTSERQMDKQFGGLAAIRWCDDTSYSIVILNDVMVDGTILYDLSTTSIDNTISVSYQVLERQHIPFIGTNILEYSERFDTYGYITDVKRRIAEETGFDLTALDGMSVSFQTKYQFWRGAIQRKGTKYAIDAFANGTSFSNAILDEFWAFEYATYGSNKTKSAPILKIDSSDFNGNEIRLDLK